MQVSEINKSIIVVLQNFFSIPRAKCYWNRSVFVETAVKQKCGRFWLHSVVRVHNKLIIRHSCDICKRVLYTVRYTVTGHVTIFQTENDAVETVSCSAVVGVRVCSHHHHKSETHSFLLRCLSQCVDNKQFLKRISIHWGECEHIRLTGQLQS